MMNIAVETLANSVITSSARQFATQFYYCTQESLSESATCGKNIIKLVSFLVWQTLHIKSHGLYGIERFESIELSFLCQTVHPKLKLAVCWGSTL